MLKATSVALIYYGLPVSEWGAGGAGGLGTDVGQRGVGCMAVVSPKLCVLPRTHNGRRGRGREVRHKEVTCQPPSGCRPRDKSATAVAQLSYVTLDVCVRAFSGSLAFQYHQPLVPPFTLVPIPPLARL